MLIGAQQTASEVERRVVANSAVRVVGRLDAAEAGQGEYGFLPPVPRQRATIVKPGTMLVSAELPIPSWCSSPSRPGPRGPAEAAAPADTPDGTPRTTRSRASRGSAVQVLHTSDWHVGKAIRGRSRAAEHREVLAEIAALADERSADLVIVAGDLFDTASPTPESERIV